MLESTLKWSSPDAAHGGYSTAQPARLDILWAPSSDDNFGVNGNRRSLLLLGVRTRPVIFLHHFVPAFGVK
jgi:hypothetical protein